MFKGSVLCGGPYGINALGAVNFALSPELSEAVNEHGPVRGPHNVATAEEYTQRGRELFQTIYQHHSTFSSSLPSLTFLDPPPSANVILMNNVLHELSDD